MEERDKIKKWIFRMNEKTSRNQTFQQKSNKRENDSLAMKKTKAEKQSVREDEAGKIHWDSKIEIDYQIPTVKPILILINKKKRSVIQWILLFQRTAGKAEEREKLV